MLVIRAAPDRLACASIGGAQVLRPGGTLVMFPEGTRSRPHRPLQFHRGNDYLLQHFTERLGTLGGYNETRAN